MANKTTANAFMASAQKSKREMADIQKEGSGKHETDEVELKKISLLIPAWLHKEAQLHRVETGESMTKLIVRLLAEELGYRLWAWGSYLSSMSGLVPAMSRIAFKRLIFPISAASIRSRP